MLSDKVVLLGHAMAIEKNDDIALATLMKFLKAHTLQEGCTLSVLGKNTKNSQHYLVYETWESRKAWHTHFQSAHVEEFYKDSKNFFTDVQFTLYTPFFDTLSVCKYLHMKPYENSIIALGTIHAHEGKELETRQDVTACITRNKEEKGCLYSALHIEQEDGRQFMGFEIWESQMAWIQHIQQPHVTVMTEKLPQIAESSIIDTYKVIPLL